MLQETLRKIILLQVTMSGVQKLIFFSRSGFIDVSYDIDLTTVNPKAIITSGLPVIYNNIDFNLSILFSLATAFQQNPATKSSL